MIENKNAKKEKNNLITRSEMIFSKKFKLSRKIKPKLRRKEALNKLFGILRNITSEIRQYINTKFIEIR